MAEATSSADALVSRLREAGCVFAEEEADLLRSTAQGAELESMVRRRVAGEPLEHIVGWVRFCGLRIVVEPGVFVPRGRTAALVAEATARIRPGDVVVDLCCGSGAVGAAIARGVDVQLFAVDIDPVAVACARRNVGTGTVLQGDLFAALPPRLRGSVDVVVVNAPYVPTEEIALMPSEARLHEPLTALDGGPDGVDVHRQVAADAGGWLRPGGWLLVETSDRQADLTARALRAHSLVPQVLRSEELGATVVVGRATDSWD